MAKRSREANSAWEDFLQRIEQAKQEVAKTDKEWWYRGAIKSTYDLMPSLFRGYKKPNSERQWSRIWARESDLFWEFSARARELHSHIRSDWDYLFAMQHYRTPTRLLDWTEVLGVAVYFALEDFKQKRASVPPCVWVLNPYELNRVSTDNRYADIFAPENIGWDEDENEYYTYGELLVEDGIGFKYPRSLYPRQSNPRIHAQRAWFTIHGDEYVPINKLDDSDRFVRQVILPLEAIPAARRFLEMAGIDSFLLFADLENLSRSVTRKNMP